jgi:hypothetical protein
MDELRADADLADTHRVNPHGLAIGDCLFEFRIEPAEPLQKPSLPIAPSLHSEKVIGASQNKEDCE